MTTSKVHVTGSLKDNKAGFVIANLYNISQKKLQNTEIMTFKRKHNTHTR